MSRRSNTQGRRWSTCAVVVMTTFILAGCASIVYLYFLIYPMQKPLAVTQRTVVTTSTNMRFLFVGAESATLMSEDGAVERMSIETFVQRMGGTSLFLEGSNVASGAATQLSRALAATRAPQTLASPHGAYTIRLGEPSGDDTSVVFIQRTTEVPQKNVLRDARMTLQDARIIGWISEQEFVVEAQATSTRALFGVTISGTLRYLAPMLDTVVYLMSRDSAIWYVTAVLGEGIESMPQGPSELHRIQATGDDMRIVRDEAHVVTSVLSDPYTDTSRIAYTTDDGEAHVLSIGNGLRTSIGMRRPLLFLRTGEVLARDGFDLVRINIATGAVQKIGAAPEGNLDIFDITNFPTL